MTLLYALALLAAVVGLLAFLFKLWRLVTQPLPQEKLQKLDQIDLFAQTLGQLNEAVNTLQAQLGRDSAFQSNLSKVLEEVGKASTELATLKGERGADLREFRGQLDQLTQELGDVSSTLTGRRSGMAGENILREALSRFPPEWVRSPYYDVEFGFVLFDRRVIPVDSKFSGAELLEQLGATEDDGEKIEISQQIERQVLSRAKEVAKYIDPHATTSVAICSIPDSAYSLLRRAHLQSYIDHRVIIVPYSMTVPYLLSLYDLHLKTIGQIDEACLETFVDSIEQAVKALKDTLENKVKEANARLGNAYRECVQAVSTIEGSLTALRAARVQTVSQKEV